MGIERNTPILVGSVTYGAWWSMNKKGVATHIKRQPVSGRCWDKVHYGRALFGVRWSEHHGYKSHERSRGGKALGEEEVPCITW